MSHFASRLFCSHFGLVLLSVDQWSPLNLEGKKQYDREFILQLQFVSESTTKPAGLPDLPDIILDKVKTTKPAGLPDLPDIILDKVKTTKPAGLPDLPDIILDKVKTTKPAGLPDLPDIILD